MTEYQGIGEISVFRSPVWYLRQIKKCYVEFGRNLVSNNAFGNHFVMRLISIFWIIFLIVFTIALVKLIMRHEIRFRNFMICILVLFCMPVTSLLFYLGSEDVFYHILMKESLALCWLFPIIYVDQELRNNKGRLVGEIVTCILAVILGNTAIGDNILYLSLYTSYEKTFALENRIVYRVEQLSTEELKCVYIHENLRGEDYSDNNLDQADIDAIATKTGIIPYAYNTHVWFINHYIGGNYSIPTEGQIADIRNSEEFNAMPVWPADESVEIIKDVIVVKLGH